MSGGTLALSWGRYGGFYASHYRDTKIGTGRYMRVCLGWVALTWMPADLDDILQAALDYQEAADGP